MGLGSRIVAPESTISVNAGNHLIRLWCVLARA
jgi:hypothetical protein